MRLLTSIFAPSHTVCMPKSRLKPETGFSLENVGLTDLVAT